MRRFFIQEPLNEMITIRGADAYHMLHVLRYKIGQSIIVVDCVQKIAEMEIIAIKNQEVMAKVVHYLEHNTEAPIEITLAQCLPKADKMDFIVQKAVELGVSNICPVNSENCVVKYDAAKREKRQEKWQKIAYEAAKQCGRTAVPNVEPILNLKETLDKLTTDVEAFICYEGDVKCSIKSLLTSTNKRKFFILIGPEGGFSPAEVLICQEYGLKIITLGPRILRTETASLAAVSFVMYEHGDLGG